MPPRKRGPSSSAIATASTPSSSAKKQRQSRLAKENSLSNSEEAEIKEVFRLFAYPHEGFPDEKEGVLTREDVRKALLALGLQPADSRELSSMLSAVDPTSSGFVPYEPFLVIAAAKLRSRSDDKLDEEVDLAFRLFTHGSDGPITLAHLRKIARELKEDAAGEELLKDMILEANGGDGVNAGVTKEQFKNVLSRAGAF